jgi:hypothetical protein
MGSPKPKAAPVAAVAKQSSLDIKRSQNEAADELRRRRGHNQSEFAGETGMLSASSALG